MPTREEMIAELKRQDMISALKSAETASRPEKSMNLPAEIKGAAAKFAEFAPLQGLRDIASAGAGALIGEAGEVTGLGKVTDQEWLGSEPKDFGERYQQQLVEMKRGREEALKESKVGKYIGGAAGLASNFLIPLGGPTTSAVKEIGKQAVLTGIDTATKEGGFDVKQGLKGAGIGTAFDVGTRGLVKGAKAAVSGITNIPSDLAKYYRANVADVEKARPVIDIADSLKSAADDFYRELSTQSTKAFNILKNSGKTVTKDELRAPIQEIINDIGDIHFTPESKEALNYINVLNDSLNNFQDKPIPLDTVKKIVRQIDNVITKEGKGYANVRSQELTELEKQLRKLRKSYDSILKKDELYAKEMENLAEKSSTINELSKQLKDPKSIDAMIKRLANNKDPRAAQALQALDETMGTNFGKEIIDAGVKNIFERENARGARNTFVATGLGVAAGSLLGLPPWITGGISSAGGPVIDRFGRKIYKDVLRMSTEAPEIMQKYGKVLSEASLSGPASLIATHQLLMKKDPKYAEMYNQQNSDFEENP